MNTFNELRSSLSITERRVVRKGKGLPESFRSFIEND